MSPFSLRVHWQWFFMEWKHLVEENVDSHWFHQYLPWFICDFSSKNFCAETSSIQSPILFSSYSFLKDGLCYFLLLVKKEREVSYFCTYIYTYMLRIYAHTGNSSRVLLLLFIHMETAYYTQYNINSLLYTSQQFCCISESEKLAALQ